MTNLNALSRYSVVTKRSTADLRNFCRRLRETANRNPRKAYLRAIAEHFESRIYGNHNVIKD